MSQELKDAINLAQEYGAFIQNLTGTGFQAVFDDNRLARAFTRRVNQATSLTALINNNVVDVSE